MRRRSRPGGGRQVELTVESIGARGDGVGRLDGRPVFLPLTVPGDRVRARLVGTRAAGAKGEVLEMLDRGPGRVSAPCPHFGPCGGCALQHLEDGRYADWKRDQVVTALRRKGFAEVPLRPLARIPPGTRRRATLTALRLAGRVVLGFHERDSHTVVDLKTCLLLAPRLMAIVPVLRNVLAEVLDEGRSATVSLTEGEEGLDLLLTCKGDLDLAARQVLAGLAETEDLARLSWAAPGGAPEPLALRRPPRIRFAGTAVEPPPGGFLQPTAEGEAALVDAVVGCLPDGVRGIAELYAGCGTFTFPLAVRAKVHAVESDAAALAALWAAARRDGLAGRITVETRDLSRRPLDAEELRAYDAVVFDPPRAGAKEQAARIAQSEVPLAVAVSCSPNSFARDARILADGGFRLTEVTPIDQFPWSGHLELVAGFRR